MAKSANNKPNKQASYNKRREQDSERRQRAALRAAGQCFAEGGYRKTTVAAIAKRAGVSKGLIFHFYGDKESLFTAVVEDSLEQWALLSNYRAAESSDNALQELQSLFLASFEFLEQYPVISLFSDKTDNHLSKYKNEFSKMNTRWRRRIKQSLKRGVDNQEIDSDLDLDRVATVFHELQTALIQHAPVKNTEKGTEARFDHKTVQLGIEILLKGIAR